MTDLKVLVFLSQGSPSFQRELKKIGFSLDDGCQVFKRIDRFKLLKFAVLNLSSIIRSYPKLKKFFQKRRNESIFYDGLRLKDQQNYKFYRVAYLFYFFIQSLYLASFKVSHRFNVLVLPDEVYGNSLICALFSCPNSAILTNFSDTGKRELPYFSILKFQSCYDYVYEARNYFDLEGLNPGAFQEEWVIKFLDDIKNRKSADKSSWGQEIALTNNLNSTGKKRPLSSNNDVLIAGHIFADAPSAQNMEYLSYEEWLFDILPALKEKFDTVFYKPHPGTSNYQKEAKRLEKILGNKIFDGVRVLDRLQPVNLKNFKWIISCNGTVLFEASLKDANCLSFAEGLSLHLPKVWFVRNSSELKKINYLGGQTNQKDSLSRAHYSSTLVRFYWYNRNFIKTQDLDEFAKKIKTALLTSASKNSVYQFCDLPSGEIGLLPVNKCCTFY